MNSKLSDIVESSIEERTDEVQPLFYSVVGSRLFGIEKEDSDYDIRGFHIAPIENYGKLTQPQERIKTTESYSFGEVELKSYELRTFCSHILKGDFNIVEMMFVDSEYIIMNRCNKEVESLEKTIKSYLPMNLPKKYMGMAKSHYHRYVESDGFKLKRYIHLIRGVLSTKYLLKNNKLNPSMNSLIESESNSKNKNLVKKLVDTRKNNLLYTDDFIDEMNDLIDELMLLDIQDTNYDRDSLEEDLNDWMVNMRDEYE